MFLLVINLVPTKASLLFNIVVRILPRMTLTWWLLRLKQLGQKVLTERLPLGRVILGSGSIRQEPNSLTATQAWKSC